MKVRLIRPAYFIWVLLPIALYGAFLTFGLPHMIWSYSWRDEGQGYDPFAARHYTSCTYAGPYGVFKRPANAGKCPWLIFRKDQKGTGLDLSHIQGWSGGGREHG
ncbi:hypothetical protein B7H23_01260 [Notoacmeibacter marinus]|uniref:Uncharacterized protein n=1 Tax=Notoacmeibacter marinus TaxID=1876515 RepID=A0A231V0B1_9HYPH|nr:hypothetical protein [Notoacmeibacter marinus]OXT01628.1 hypothetical protein B7H23_01260 [Notoacmeibacter marinus]